MEQETRARPKRRGPHTAGNTRRERNKDKEDPWAPHGCKIENRERATRFAKEITQGTGTCQRMGIERHGPTNPDAQRPCNALGEECLPPFGLTGLGLSTRAHPRAPRPGGISGRRTSEGAARNLRARCRNRAATRKKEHGGLRRAVSATQRQTPHGTGNQGTPKATRASHGWKHAQGAQQGQGRP